MYRILRKIVESDERPWYRRLQRELGMSNEVFRRAINKLREEGILEKNRTKAKRIPLRFERRFRNTFPFIKIPNTYLSKKQLEQKEHTRGPRISAGNRKIRHEGVLLIRFQKILQYLLLRAVFGATYAIKKVDPTEACKPGQIVVYKDKMRKTYYSYQDLQFESTRRLVDSNFLSPVNIGFDTIPGVSIEDLVHHRDIGSDRLFSYTKTSSEECETVLSYLVRQGVLIPLTYDEVRDAIGKMKRPERYSFLLTETRYKVSSEVLEDYIDDWNGLIDLVVRRIRVRFMMDSKMSREEEELYEYLYDVRDVKNFRTFQKVECRNMSVAEKNNGMAQVRTPYGAQERYYPSKVKLNESYHKEIKYLDRSTFSKLEEIRFNKDYSEIRNKYPFLHKMLIEVLDPISDLVGLANKDLDW